MAQSITEVTEALCRGAAVSRGPEVSIENAAAILQEMARLSGGSSTKAQRNTTLDAALRNRALIEMIPAVTFIASLNALGKAHEFYVSPQIEQLLGFSQDEWVANPRLWYDQLHPDDRTRWGKDFAATCSTGVNFQSEYRLIARDGREVWVRGECQVIRDDDGRPLFLQGIAFDITESKRAEEALRAAHAELETRVAERTAELARLNESLRQEVARRKQAKQEALQRQAEVAQLARVNAMGQMATSLAHELNQPLTAIRNYAHACKSLLQSGNTAKIPETLERLDHAAARAGQIIQRIKDFVGSREPTHRPTDLGQLIQRTIDLMNPILQLANVTTQLNIAPAMPQVIVDPVQIEQVLVNLIQNALDAMSETPPERRFLSVTTVLSATGVRIDVLDHGCGIPADEVTQLFEEFFTTKSQGLGLGLAISKNIMERHGGTLTAGADAEGYTVFSLFLPGS